MLLELTSMCRQTVTLAPSSGLDAYGVRSYGAAVTYRARVSGKRRMVLNREGQQVLSQYTVYLVANPAIGDDDLLTLSTGDVGSTDRGAINPKIINVAKYPDDFGRMTTVVYL